MKKFHFSIIAAVMIGLTACSTVQTTDSGAVGVKRKQFMLLPEKQVESMATQSYLETLKEADSKQKLNPNPQQTERVRAIAKRLIAQTGVFRKDALDWKWEVNVQDNKDVNAYCMPGGKIMVYTGLIEKMQATENELAAVMGHEISHALREHGRERMSEAYAQQAALLGLGLLVGVSTDSENAAATTVQLGSMVAGVALTLPHSRQQEREADRMGLELSARAGYNPNGAISLWQKMSANSGAKPPEFLSTHPAEASRIQDMERLLPTVMPLYEVAKNKSPG